MGKEVKAWKRMMIGAAIGAAISLLDKETRSALNVKALWRQRADCFRDIQKRVRQCRQSLETLTEDALFIAEKIKEIVEKTPEVIEFLKETKETYRWKKDDPQTKK